MSTGGRTERGAVVEVEVGRKTRVKKKKVTSPGSSGLGRICLHKSQDKGSSAGFLVSPTHLGKRTARRRGVKSRTSEAVELELS